MHGVGGDDRPLGRETSDDSRSVEARQRSGRVESGQGRDAERTAMIERALQRLDRRECRQESRKRWTDVVKYNVEDLWLTVEYTGNRAEWRRRTRVADPSPEGFTA